MTGGNICVTICRPHLFVEDFVLYTDNSCLRWFILITEPLVYMAMDLFDTSISSKRVQTNMLWKMTALLWLHEPFQWQLQMTFKSRRPFLHIDFLYGTPKTLLTDNGPKLNGMFMIKVQRVHGVKLQATLTCHTKTERCNQTLLAVLRRFFDDHPEDCKFISTKWSMLTTTKCTTQWYVAL